MRRMNGGGVVSMKITAQTSYLFILLFQYYVFVPCVAKPKCTTPSACGIITNISSPLRLRGDPKHCGDRRLELVCENNVTFFYFNSQKYVVKEIDYTSSSFRLVDASLQDHTCSFPTFSLYAYDYTLQPYPYFLYPYREPRNIIFFSCPYRIDSSSSYVDITPCNSSHSRFTYIKVGYLKASEIKQMCGVDVIVMTSWDFRDPNYHSLQEIHHSLMYGFRLQFCPECTVSWTLSDLFIDLDRPEVLQFIPFVLVGANLPVMIIIGFTCGFVLLFFHFRHMSMGVYHFNPLSIRDWHSLSAGSISAIIPIIMIIVPRFIICPLLVWYFIYKYRRRHLSSFEAIESFLRSDNKLMPIRYTYSDIKKMTKCFKDKLGEGGYGTVYKGKLRSGNHVAVKLLGKSGTNGQDFMNEIATIGRIHHVNVVQLIGYCAQGSKHALVFDFMPNGSLEKYIFNAKKLDSLNWDTKLDIAIGVARGIEYLHRGCDFQIVHCDIKPHNILLDDKFIPKISDFGLAKLCSTKKNTMTLTAARGTIVYVAPELINISIGRVSYKADVYSFGMLLLEIVSLKRDLIRKDDGSDKYFPYWIYDCFNQGKDIEIAKADDGDTKKLARKMTIVALWCIQISPDDRPSMNKVLEMLEGDVQRLQLPRYPPSQDLMHEDQIGTTCSNHSISSPHHEDHLSCVEINVQ